MIQVYGYLNYSNKINVISFFLYDPTRNLRTAYTGTTAELTRKPFVYDPDDAYLLLDIETVHRLPNREKLLSIFKNLHPELFI